MNSKVSTNEVVYDLVHIHEDRINDYTQVLLHLKSAGLDIKSLFERILEESIEFVRQLKEKIRVANTGEGKIYKTWASRKKPIIPADQKSMAKICIDNELATFNAYSTALSLSSLELDIKELLQTQQEGVKKLHAHIQHYYHAQ